MLAPLKPAAWGQWDQPKLFLADTRPQAQDSDGPEGPSDKAIHKASSFLLR